MKKTTMPGLGLAALTAVAGGLAVAPAAEAGTTFCNTSISEYAYCRLGSNINVQEITAAEQSNYNDDSYCIGAILAGSIYEKYGYDIHDPNNHHGDYTSCSFGLNNPPSSYGADIVYSNDGTTANPYIHNEGPTTAARPFKGSYTTF